MLGKLLTELDTPLVEGVDSPDSPLREDAVLIESDQDTKGVRVEFVCHDDIRRAVPLEDAVRIQPIGSPLGLHLLRCLAESERLGLREDIGNEVIVMVAQLVDRLV